MTKATRNLHPLHFEDLEPHRFEDLVRQLIYEFQDWTALEAVGRTGVDEGMDIRGWAAVGDSFATASDVDVADEEETAVRDNVVEERLWVIQCKRYQKLGPARLGKVVDANLNELPKKPDGYLFVSSVDFSVKARRKFAAVVAEHDIAEARLLGKAELEDLLFRPENDHLLFAYFGVSLQIRRRSAKARIRSNLTLKRALNRHLHPIAERASFVDVLIRDPNDRDYPLPEDDPAPRSKKWQLVGQVPVEHVSFVKRKYLGYLDQETGEWDALTDFPVDHVPRAQEDDLTEICRLVWDTLLPEYKKASFLEVGKIPYSRILAVDDVGDAYHEPPHLVVDFADRDDPFEPEVIPVLEPESHHSSLQRAHPDDKIDMLRKLVRPHLEERQNHDDDEWAEVLEKKVAAAKGRLLAACEAFVAGRYKRVAERRFVSSPEVSNDLSDNQVSSFKDEVRELVDAAPSAVTKHIVESQFWQEQDVESYGYMREMEFQEGLEDGIRLILGLLGPVLVKYGYMKRSEWRGSDTSRHYHRPNAQPRYPYHLQFSDELDAAIRQYKLQVKKLRLLERQQVTAPQQSHSDDEEARALRAKWNELD